MGVGIRVWISGCEDLGVSPSGYSDVPAILQPTYLPIRPLPISLPISCQDNAADGERAVIFSRCLRIGMNLGVETVTFVF